MHHLVDKVGALLFRKEGVYATTPLNALSTELQIGASGHTTGRPISH